MCRVTRTHTWEARISTWELTQELGLESIDVYVKRRLLRFVGHIARMPFDRTPRRMLSSWVAAPRPSGGQLMTYGRSVFKALDAFGIDHSSWSTLAQWIVPHGAGRSTANCSPKGHRDVPPPPPPIGSSTWPSPTHAEEST
jgi:hypothetical protein